MSKDFKELLAPEQGIPWANAAVFFKEIREVTKEAAGATYEMSPEERRQAVRRVKSQGALSGIRSSVSQDVTHGRRIQRTRGERTAKGVGTGLGAVAGMLAARKGGAAGKAVGSLVGAIAGRGLGTVAGKEIDLKRLKSRYKSKAKKAEMDKYSKEKAAGYRGIPRISKGGLKAILLGAGAGTAGVGALATAKKVDKEMGWEPGLELNKKAAVQRVRDLLKLAGGGEPLTDAENGPAGAAPVAGEVEPNALTQGAVAAPPKQKMPKGKGKGREPVTPEEKERANAETMLEQEAVEDKAGQKNEAEYYRNLAHEATQGLEEQQAQLQQAEGQMQQMGQQAEMAQAQATQAVQQSAQQSQQSAQQNQQLSMQLEQTGQEAMAAKENIMQMRQAMQSYRENLQQQVLQDPVAAIGPSPEEQGMPQTPEEQAMMEQQGAAGAPPEAGGPPGAPPPGAPPGAAPPEAAGQVPEMLQGNPGAEAAPAAAKPKPKKRAEKKEKKEGNKGGVTVNVEKTSAMLPFLKAASPLERGIGALVGGAGAAAIQARSDRRGSGGVSQKEVMLKAKLQHLQSKKKPSLMDQYKRIMYRAQSDMATLHRKNPKAAAAMAGAAGAAGGAAIAPTVARFGRQIFRR